jgi:hypothetical protein
MYSAAVLGIDSLRYIQYVTNRPHLRTSYPTSTSLLLPFLDLLLIACVRYDIRKRAFVERLTYTVLPYGGIPQLQYEL